MHGVVEEGMVQSIYKHNLGAGCSVWGYLTNQFWGELRGPAGPAGPDCLAAAARLRDPRSLGRLCGPLRPTPSAAARHGSAAASLRRRSRAAAARERRGGRQEGGRPPRAVSPPLSRSRALVGGARQARPISRLSLASLHRNSIHRNHVIGALVVAAPGSFTHTYYERPDPRPRPH
jgi:hypothetical protein